MTLQCLVRTASRCRTTTRLLNSATRRSANTSTALPQQRLFVPATAPARTSRSLSTATVANQEEESFSFPSPADSHTTATTEQPPTAAAVAANPKQKKEPRRRTTLETKDPLLITPAAAVRIQELLAGDGAPDQPIGIRLGVKRRGCNGLSYTLNYAQEVPAKDIAMESHGVKVFIEPMALFSIVGTTMDWEETELASEFTFTNPNSKGECGCGESFNV
jgi:iron-sulfur cluster assembly accessory protein